MSRLEELPPKVEYNLQQASVLPTYWCMRSIVEIVDSFVHNRDITGKTIITDAVRQVLCLKWMNVDPIRNFPYFSV